MVAAVKLPAAAAEFDIVRTEDVEPSPLNYRKTFANVGELGEDIKANGLRVPIKVRPNPRKTSKYELVYGERRWRGAQAAGVERLPALIQDLNDEEVVKEQLIENGSREDVHPLEEADLFKRMVDEYGYEREAIADMIGKSRSHVHARMKLCDLKGKLAREAFLDDKINASIALLAARIPEGKLQDSFVKDVLEGPGNEREHVHGEWVEIKRPLSYREAQLHAQKHYMLRLDQAPFSIVSETLVKEVGACTSCVHRTGNQRELFDDVKSADVCTNPPCFSKKQSAQFALDSKQHASAGDTVLSAAEAKKVFQVREYNGEVFLPYGSKYKALQGNEHEVDDRAPYELDKKRRPWAELFGGEDKIPVVLAKAPDGSTWKLVDVHKARKELEKAGAIAKSKAATSGSKKSSPAKPKLPTAEELAEVRTRKKVIEALVAKLDAKAAQHDVAFWRWFATQMFEVAYEARYILQHTRNYNGSATTIAATLLKGAKTSGDYRKLVLEAFIADQIGNDYGGKHAIDDKTKDACKLFKVDWEELASDALAEAKKVVEERDAKKAKPKAKKGK